MDASIGDVADLITVERTPVLAEITSVEWQDVLEIHKVDEGIASIASILEVDGEIEEVNDPRPKPVFRELR